MSDFVEHTIAHIRKLVGDKAQVIGAVSGGVDSTVVARLMQVAIGNFVDSRFLRRRLIYNQATDFMPFSLTTG